jgi:hypothetical protein
MSTPSASPISVNTHLSSYEKSLLNQLTIRGEIDYKKLAIIFLVVYFILNMFL